jgi:hypothetical protein
MKQKYIIALVLVAIVVIAGIATTIALVVPKKKTEPFLPILTISCADCLTKCNDKYKNDPTAWNQCTLDSINNPDCKCPDIKTILDTKL